MVTFINEMLRVILISFFAIAAVCGLFAVVYLGAVISIWNIYAGIFYVYILIVISVTVKRVLNK